MKTASLKTIIPYLISTVIIVLFLITENSNRNTRQELENELESMIRQIDNYRAIYHNSLNISYQNQLISTQKINNIQIENFKSESIGLHEKLKAEYSLIYFFENGMCQACVEKELNNFRGLLSNLSFPIVGIFKGYSTNYLRNDPSFQGLKEHIFISTEYPTKTKNLTGTPFVALVNSEQEVVTANHASKIDNLAFEYFFDVVQSISKK